MKHAVISLTALILCVLFVTAGCTAAPKQESSAPVSAASSVTQPAPATVDEPVAETVPASPDSAIADEGNITYNELEIKKNLSEIESKLDRLIDDQHFMGSVYTKVGNDFDYIKAKGFANQGAHVENSIYRSGYVGSLTKLFTATAVMKLAEEKVLSLDDTLDRYFSSCIYGKDVTIRQLLTMTSGIPNYLTREPVRGSAVTLNSDLRDKISADGADENNKSTILSWILSRQLQKDKVGRFDFSDSNYYLLGEIIGAAADEPYETYLTEEIFKPIYMNKTGFDPEYVTARPYESRQETAALLRRSLLRVRHPALSRRAGRRSARRQRIADGNALRRRLRLRLRRVRQRRPHLRRRRDRRLQAQAQLYRRQEADFCRDVQLFGVGSRAASPQLPRLSRQIPEPLNRTSILCSTDYL